MKILPDLSNYLEVDDNYENRIKNLVDDSKTHSQAGSDELQSEDENALTVANIQRLMDDYKKGDQDENNKDSEESSEPSSSESDKDNS